MAQRDETLQRYFDGALPEMERSAVEAALDDSDRRKLTSLAEVGQVLRAGLDAEARDVDLLRFIDAALAAGGAPRSDARRRRWIGATVGALALAAALLLLPRTQLITNACDIESLEVEGAVATVFTNDDTTVLWFEGTGEH
jgi:hypothetical protein